MNRRGFFAAIGAIGGALVLPEEPEGLERSGIVYSFAKNLRVPGLPPYLSPEHMRLAMEAIERNQYREPMIGHLSVTTFYRNPPPAVRDRSHMPFFDTLVHGSVISEQSHVLLAPAAYELLKAR